MKIALASLLLLTIFSPGSVRLLRQMNPNASAEWLRKLPQMAKRLEVSLYRSAKSFQAYNDITTLKQRLQMLAIDIGTKTKKLQQAHMRKQRVPPQPQHSQPFRPPAQQQQYPTQQVQPQPQPQQVQPQPSHQMIQSQPAQPIQAQPPPPPSPPPPPPPPAQPEVFDEMYIRTGLSRISLQRQ
mmetsp:Transcript_24429/g.56928  ORF Transcript_24429/g.56928 Transcript_24429/m.56928 type:complete len:183 (-) Transcript_24429:223-771(-)